MWPWGHAALGYLLYRLLTWQREWRLSDGPVIALAIGTQFPDLIDKPLAWTFGVIPSGRSLTHSLISAAIILTVVLYITRRSSRKSLGIGFAVGYLSHLLGDALSPLLELDVVFLRFLLWPLYPPPPYESDSSFLVHFLNMEMDSFFMFELAIFFLGVVVWVYDGYPGLQKVTQFFRR
ncbi:metal-dependent hydrolase [Haloprofundus sp. MHR1]|uniref:metal-dependent hydrolase n=1 Tax=Haloprofundus sp. MHR1 TaxID=2572921 RepID=UPI00143CEFC7|nr:metal-dependent hydrolase [Haloprofundus sp. MHR1]